MEYSKHWSRMREIRGEDTFTEDSYSSPREEGGTMLSPPNRAGKLKSLHSMSLGGVQPVSTEMSFVLMFSSRGSKRKQMLGVV